MGGYPGRSSCVSDEGEEGRGGEGIIGPKIQGCQVGCGCLASNAVSPGHLPTWFSACFGHCHEATARRRVGEAELRTALELYMRRFVEVYGEDSVTPKFHYALHLPQFLGRFGFLPSCFVQERKHRVGKRYSTDHRNTSLQWEASVLREVSAHHVGALEREGGGRFAAEAALEKPRPAGQKLTERLRAALGAPAALFSVARTAKLNAWERASVGDVLLARQGDDQVAGEAMLFAAANMGGNEVVFAVLRRWAFVSAGPRSTKWRPSDEVYWCTVDEIRCAATWSAGGEVVTVLNPHRV